MGFHRGNIGWAVKTWVILSVFILPFLEMPLVVGWMVLGAALGLWWRQAPEAPPEKPVEKLPFHDQYADRQIPRRGE